MRQRSRAGGEPVKPRGRKRSTPKTARTVARTWFGQGRSAQVFTRKDDLFNEPMLNNKRLGLSRLDVDQMPIGKRSSLLYCSYGSHQLLSFLSEHSNYEVLRCIRLLILSVARKRICLPAPKGAILQVANDENLYLRHSDRA
jgi:hypothetical protein